VKSLYKLSLFLWVVGITMVISPTYAKVPKSKFYDFNEQLIDGNRKKPIMLFSDARQKVKFDRLLRLKKSFIPKLFSTAKERVFK
tara:strand:- start:833 stop:1087 length:255 start_codon:yes stop_codon:yes gene_type:complete